MIQNSPGCSKMFQNVPDEFRLVQNVLKCSEKNSEKASSKVRVKQNVYEVFFPFLFLFRKPII